MRKLPDRWLLLGTYHEGTLKVRRVEVISYIESNDESPTHSGLGLYGGERWRYPEGSKEVYWWHYPSEEAKAAVDVYLAKRGFSNLTHKEMMDGSLEDEVSSGRISIPRYLRDLEKSSKSPFYKSINEVLIRRKPQTVQTAGSLVESLYRHQTMLIEELLTEAIEVVHFDEELDDAYDLVDQAEAIFKECHIGLSRDKDLTLLAVNDGTLVGALYSSSSMEDEDGNEYMECSFDIAVKPEFHKSGIGTMLTSAYLKSAAGDGMLPVKVRVWVVNRNMERVLEKMGFSDGDEERHSGGSCHMEKWLY